MSAFRGGQSAGAADQQKTPFLHEMDNMAHQAEAEHPPAIKGAIGLIEILVGVLANVVQVATSTQAFVSMAAGAGVRFYSASDLFHALPYISTMALMIALAVQSFLHANAQGMSSTMARLRHIQHFRIKTPSSRTEVIEAITIKSIVFVSAFVCDVVGDATFARLYTSEPFFIGAWVIMLTASSTILLYDGSLRVWGAIQDFRDYSAYHASFKEE